MPSEIVGRALPWRAGLLVLVLSLAGGTAVLAVGAATSASPETRNGEYVLRLYQRILSVGKSLLTLEDATLYRLSQKRPVDLERVAAKVFSARRQIRSLRRVARQMEKRLSSSDPRLAKIESLKGSFRLILEAHRTNLKKIKQAGGEEFSLPFTPFDQEESVDNVASDTCPYPGGKIDDLF